MGLERRMLSPEPTQLCGNSELIFAIVFLQETDGEGAGRGQMGRIRARAAAF